MDRAPGRIGFMSTQRRENRWRPVSCIDTAEALMCFCLASFVRLVYANASGTTAPPALPAWFRPDDEDMSPGASELATNSLRLDHRIVRLAWLVRQDIRHNPRSSSPPGAGSRSEASFRSSFPPIPSPTALARLHPSLPRVPAGLSRWTERYDGKGNLHFQHAA